MSKTVWVANLPDNNKVLVKKDDQVTSNQILAKTETKEIKAPTAGRVVEVENKKIKLELEMDKISGQGANKFHAWGKINCQPKVNYSQLNSEYQNQILVIEAQCLTSHLAAKAKALGVKGIIVYNGEVESKDWPLPLLTVEKESLDLIKKKEGVKCLLDAQNNCLLVPESD